MNGLRRAGTIERPTNPWLAFALAPLLVIIGTVLGVLLRGFIPVTGGALGFSIDLAVLFAPIAGLVGFWRSRVERGDLASLGLGDRVDVLRFLRGFAIGLGLFTAVVLVLFVTETIQIDRTPMDPVGWPAFEALAIVLVGWTVQSTTEELVARGWLLSTMAARTNLATAVIASSVLFSLLHVFNDNVSLVAMANILLVGIFLALFSIVEGGIWGVAGIHAAWNFTQANVFGLEVSGSDPAVGTALDLEENGPGLLTGDLFGPEAGLAATGVILAALAVTWLVLRRSVSFSSTPNSAGTAP